MDTPATPHERLREAREQAGFRSAAAFAARHGLSEVTYRSHENGVRALTLPAAKRYAKLLKRDFAWLLTGQEPAAAPAPELPLFGYAGAGAQVFPFDGNTDPVDYVPAPPDLERGAAVIVKGDSMLPRFADGDTLYFDRGQTPIEFAIGRECVVQVENGPVLVKRVERGTRKGRFHLMSINPAVPTLEDQRLTWAAEIRWTRNLSRKRRGT